MGLMYVGYPNREWPESHRWPLEFVTRWHDGTDDLVHTSKALCVTDALGQSLYAP